MTSQEITSLAHGLLAAQRIFAEKTAPFVKEWAQLRVLHLDLMPSEADRDFTFVDMIEEDRVLIFDSEDWEESWQYGGHEKHWGRMLDIPFDFFDDPQPYRDEANQLVRDREARGALAMEQARNARIAALEAELAKARAEG